MGIRSLNSVLREHCHSVFRPVHVGSHALKKVAVDASIYFYRFKSTLGQRWLEGFVGMITSFRRWNVHLVFIFDGVSPPEKDVEKQKRHRSRDQQKGRLAALEQELVDYRGKGLIGPLARELFKKQKGYQPQMVRDQNGAGPELSGFDPELSGFDPNGLVDVIERKKAQMVEILPDDLGLAKALLDTLAVPWVVAPGEAERYASELCVGGLVGAVLSEDTDVLAYGAPCWLSGFNGYADSVVEVRVDDVLGGLKMNLFEFRDMCILLGTDFNTNIPGVGPKSVHKLLTAHRTIEGVLSSLGVDGACLNFVRCREMFDLGGHVGRVSFCGVPNFDALKDFLQHHDIRVGIERIKKAMGAVRVILEK